MASSDILVRILGDSKGVEAAIDGVGKKADDVLGTKLSGIISKSLKALPIAGAVAGVGLLTSAIGGAIRNATDLSDEFKSISSRINLMNDGTQTNAQLLDKVYASAQRARGSYYDMASTVSKLGILAKDAFSSNDEMIAFAEQMNKQFKIGGASIQEQTAAMYQLTQALASGRLQGDEFRSIMENAPMLAQTIANEFGVSVGKLREMSSEGLITADIIKNAMFNSAEETNAKFAQLPMTFADISLQISNEARKAFEPLLTSIGEITASSDFKLLIDGIGSSFQIMAAAGQVGFAVLSGAFQTAKVAAKLLFDVVKAGFSIITASVPLATAAIVGYTTAVAISTATQKTMAAMQALSNTHTAVAIMYGATIGTITKTNAIAYGLAAAKAMLLGAAQTALNTRTALAIAQGVVLGTITRATAVAYGLATVKTYAMAAAQRVLNLVLKMNPIGFVISLIAALASAFIASSIAANGLGESMAAIWNSIVHTTTWAINNIISMINKLIGGINAVGSRLGQVFKFDYSAISELSEISASAAQEFADKGRAVGSSFAKAFTGEVDGGIGDMEIPAGGGGGGGSADTGSSKGGGGNGSTKEALEEAKRIHKAIVDDWTNMFGTKADIAKRWYDTELAELEKSKANNEYYQEDLTRLNEMYADKREKALIEEAKRAREIQNSVRDLSLELNFSLLSKDSEGSSSPTEKLIYEHENAVNAIKDKWDNLSSEYGEMTKRDQQNFIESLKARDIAFELSADNQISFTAAKNAQLLAEEEKYFKQHEELVRTNADAEFAIKEAMRTQDFESLKLALNDEYITLSEHNELKKQMLEDYKQAAMDAHYSLQELTFNSMNASLDSLQSNLSGILQGTTSIATAFQNLGKAMLKAISDYISNWITAKLRQSLLEKQLTATQTATSVASAQAQLPAWTQLAQQVAMATFGASATAGMAAWQAGSMAGSFGGLGGGLASRVKLPLMANGGKVTGPTLAMIGEGKYEEAVVPYSERTFREIGEGVANASGGGVGGNVTIHVAAMDAHSFSGWLNSSAGKELKQYLFDQDREFIGTQGAW